MPLPRNITKWLFAIAIFLMFSGLPAPPETISAEGDYNLALYQIKNKMVGGILRIKTIPIRRESFQMPAQSLPLLQLQPVSQEQVNAQLSKLITQFSRKKSSSTPKLDQTDILSAKVGSKIYWVNKASGAYTFSETAKLMSVPAPKEDNKQALEWALASVAKYKLVQLGPYEMFDVISTSQIWTAAVKGDTDEPMVEYPSDYIIVLGRRYQGTPMVGSSLVLRLSGRGKLLGVQKNWRPITGEQGTARVEEATLLTNFEARLLEAGILKDGQTVERDVIILNTACGYLEGPVGNEQVMMGPGALVTFRLRTAGSMDQASQVAIPLAVVEFPILGVGKYFNEPPRE